MTRTPFAHQSIPPKYLKKTVFVIQDVEGFNVVKGGKELWQVMLVLVFKNTGLYPGGDI